MIENFIINCKRCPIPTPTDIRLLNSPTQVIVTLECRGCGLTEQQVVPTVPTPYVGFPIPGMPNQTLTTPMPEPEPEPAPWEPSEKSKLMRKLIDEEDMHAVEAHKFDFEEAEYRYVLDTIKAHKEARKVKADGKQV